MNYSTVLTEDVNKKLLKHLIHKDYQEDLCFAFYNPSTGRNRFTGVIKSILLPEKNDRNLHGNVSFNSDYFDKVTQYALEHNLGICFIHSHPTSGWQSMSSDDIKAEEMLAPRVKTVTGLPLLGMTAGHDGTWSSRFWIKTAPKKYSRYWCDSVRVVGKGIQISRKESGQRYMQAEEFIRTISAWGTSKQNTISKLRVGIVGLGSVGSIVAEALMRTGVLNLVLIDFDRVENKNLDRLLAVNRSDVKKLKVDAIKRRLLSCKIGKMEIDTIPYSIAEPIGLQAALDCDIIFSCVDRPWPRFILDCIAYSNLIPVVDGGIDASINNSKNNLDQARWKAHVVSPGRICMQCLGQYKPEDVALEQSGLLDDPTYIKGLPEYHFINRGENVFAFSLGLAGMEMQQFLSLIIQPRGQYIGPKEYNFNSGSIDSDFDFDCKNNCAIESLLASGDATNNSLTHKHFAAEQSRLNSSKQRKSFQWLKALLLSLTGIFR